MNNYKYSFIVPSKNTPELLQRCLNSIPQREDVQIVVVDDNSDHAIVNFEEYPGLKRSNTKIIFTKEGRGAGYARNVGINNAEGKWILFADCDDYYVEGFLEVLDEELFDDLDMLCFCALSDPNDQQKRADEWVAKYYSYLGTEKEDLIRYALWEPWFKVIRHSLIDATGIRYEERPSGNDMKFGLEISAAAKSVKYLKDKLYVWTFQPDSITFKKRSFEHEFNKIDLVVYQDNFYQNHNLNDLRGRWFNLSFTKYLISNYGLKNAIKYINEIGKGMSVLGAYLRDLRHYITK